MKPLILVTGGNGRFAQILKKENKILNLKFLLKNELNILNLKSIERCLLKYKPKMLFHCAGLSRPMYMHDENISKSIDLNIIGTATHRSGNKNFKTSSFQPATCKESQNC